MTKLLELWTKLSTNGISLPFARDQATGKPSLTLLIFYVMFVLSVFSLIVLHFKPDLWIATGMTLCAMILGFVFYRMRRIDTFKFNLKDQSIEVDDKSEDKTDV